MLMKNAKGLVFAFLVALTLGTTLFVGNVLAGDTYQVTGPVLEVTDTSVTVQKGKEKWTLSRDKATKVTGELKVGAKVTIQYSMAAKEIEVKADGKAAKADAKAEKPAK
jgi:hypothetical protein